MAEWVQPVGALDHACQQRALGQIELPDIFAKVRLRRLAKAVNREAAALPEVDLVGVHLEDLLLGEAVLELEGDGDFDDLALDAALRRKKEAARQLHGQRRAAFGPAVAGREIVPQRSEDAVIVHATVLKEAAILDGDNRVDQVGRNLVVGEQAALDAVGACTQAGDQQRLKLVAARVAGPWRRRWNRPRRR